ncbi:hypothetical protein [Rivularia sp. UHCC 0363]|uniref:hypothetical protein n=1 Tax=Rivularia sp. UHCC 0363 TaxID=3110244 RepID=UPI002B2155B4|nr:hypothetical protein [Rivularia sp. UHCC 0363]MEA5597862.1 hypothetical protein [Rivularia sp. UHCC 0363]
MNILDLNQLETVQGTEVVGGGYDYKPSYKKPTINVAVAKADAAAFGENTLTITKSDAFVDSGFASISSSKSVAVTVDLKKGKGKY